MYGDGSNDLYQNLQRGSIPRLYGAAFLHESVAHAFKVESSVVFIQCIANPKINLSVAFLQAEASVQCAVEGLADIILLGPIDTSCTGVVGIKLNTVQPMSRVDAENVLSAQAQGVLRDEGDVIAIVTYFNHFIICAFRIRHILFECGVCVAIICSQREVGSNCARQRYFSSEAATLSCIYRFTSEAALGKA